MWLLCDLLCVHHFKVASFLFYSVPKGSVSHEKHLKFVHLFFVLVGGNVDPTERAAFSHTNNVTLRYFPS